MERGNNNSKDLNMDLEQEALSEMTNMMVDINVIIVIIKMVSLQLVLSNITLVSTCKERARV